MSEPLKYQSVLLVAGLSFSCIEPYDSVHERLRDAAMTAEGERFKMAPPLELTIGFKGEDGPARLCRASFNPTAIAAVYEIPPDLAKEAP